MVQEHNRECTYGIGGKRMKRKKKAEKPTCQGCKYLGFWNSGEPFCTKGIDKGCISSGFKFRVEASTEGEDKT